MNTINFIQWLAIVGPIATLTGAIYYQMREDMKQTREDMKHIAAHHREDMKLLVAHHRQDNNNMRELWKENQERWLECNLRIEKLYSCLNTNK